MSDCDLVCVGEVLYDDYGDYRVLAGAPLNAASAAAALGVKTGLISCVGESDAAAIEEELKSRNITPHLQISGKPTGRAVVELNKGIPAFTFDRDSAFDYIEATDEVIDAASKAGFVYFGTLAQRKRTTKKAVTSILDKAKGTVIYDMNLRESITESDAIIKGSLEYADIVKINEEELSFLKEIFGKEDVIQHLIANKEVKTVFLTAGGKGAFMYQEGIILKAKAKPVDVVDTTGAGDAFSAGIIKGYAACLPDLKILELAVAASSKVVQYKGAFSKEIAKSLQKIKKHI